MNTCVKECPATHKKAEIATAADGTATTGGTTSGVAAGQDVFEFRFCEKIVNINPADPNTDMPLNPLCF